MQYQYTGNRFLAQLSKDGVMGAILDVKTAMLLGETLLYNVPGTGDGYRGTEDGGC